VNADKLKHLLARLPSNQHADAKAMIALAEIAGIADIDFWQWIDSEKLTRFDLAGIDPKGNLRFLES
jgi:hypothetical protein